MRQIFVQKLQSRKFSPKIARFSCNFTTTLKGDVVVTHKPLKWLKNMQIFTFFIIYFIYL